MITIRSLTHVGMGAGPVALPALLALVLVAAAVPARALEVYDIDPAHSAAGFKVRHLFTQVNGRFTQFAGTLSYDAAKPVNSRIEITIQTTSIDTDNERRDNHLRGADFFDVEKYPQITFKSTKIEPAGEANHYRVTGDFSMHGVTKPVTVAVELLGFGESQGMGKRGGFAAQVTLDRSEFGITWNKTLDTGGLMLGNEVQVDFPIEVVLNQEKK